jgi:hypothetical protein
MARLAALPIRATAVTHHLSDQISLTSKWLLTSREHHNYTYNLTPRNLSHLAWWVHAVTGAPVEDCSHWISEVLNDEFLKSHVAEAVRVSNRRGLADLDLRSGRRAGWYAVIRALQPKHVVETGTDKGLGAVVVAAALLRNGHGNLTTMDVNPAAGYLVSGCFQEVVSVVIGDSITSISALPKDVELFIHDSDHSAEYERQEYDSIAPKLLKGAKVLSDNAHASDALDSWASETHRDFLYFQEVPDQHWYRGAGIGAAW